MAKKIILLSFATAFLAVGCVAFPEDGYYDGRYDQRYDRRYDNNDRRYDNRYDRRYDSRYEQDRRTW